MRRIAALLLAFTCMPAGAYADNQAKPEWYILSGFDGKCYKAKDRDPNMPSPAVYHRKLRFEGVTDDVTIKRASDGSVYGVAIYIQADKSWTLWFPNAGNCQTERARLQAQGESPGDPDLN